jgi:hypothetical protein
MDLYGHLIDQNHWDAAAKVTPPQVDDRSPRKQRGHCGDTIRSYTDGASSPEASEPGI